MGGTGHAEDSEGNSDDTVISWYYTHAHVPLAEKYLSICAPTDPPSEHSWKCGHSFFFYFIWEVPVFSSMQVTKFTDFQVI